MSQIGKKNAYACNICQGRVVSIDRDEGVTPFQIRCRATKDCPGWMLSAMYNDGCQILQPGYEWIDDGANRPLKLKQLDEGLVKIEDIEPDAVARTLSFRKGADQRYIRQKRWETPSHILLGSMSSGRYKKEGDGNENG